MNKKVKIIIATVAAVVVLIAVVAIGTYFAGKPDPTPAQTAEPTQPPATLAPTAAPKPTNTPEPEETTKTTIAIGGDAVMHTGLNTEAYDGEKYDYSPIFGIISNFISDADYAVCSTVTTFAPGEEYSNYPFFKSPDALAASLASVGFDLINTATSHAVDSYRDGINYTLDVLDDAGLAHVGTYRSAEERAENSGITLVDVNGVNIAFMSYTCDTNQIPVAGYEYAVNICTTDYLSGAETIDYDLLADDMAAARESGADVIMVFMSWGREFDTQPSAMQTRLADYLFEQGADVIIGGHTRVPQPMEMREVTDIDGNEKTGFICYSLGNLISCQNDAYTDISAIINITIEKGVDSGDVRIASVNYEPIYMVDLYDYGIDDYGWHFRLANLHAAIDSYESGEPWAFMTEEIYNNMVQALNDLHSFFGEEMDNYTEKEVQE